MVFSGINFKTEKNVGDPLIRSLSVYYVENFTPPPLQPISPWSEWRTVSDWRKKKNPDGQLEVSIDLSKWINLPGQYRVRLISADSGSEIEILQAEIFYDDRKALNEFVEILGNEININRTAMVTEESSSVLKLTMECEKNCKTKVEFKPATLY